MAKQYTPQITLQYSIFIKRALVEALEDAFSGYQDPTINKARIAVDFDTRRWALPGIIVKFNETEPIRNAGVAHVEYLVSPDDPDPNHPSQFIKYHHLLYHGEIVFDIWGQSSVDRDVVRDALIEVIGMNRTGTEGVAFIDRLYWQMSTTPYGDWHFPVLNTDLINPGGESVEIAPWQPEDILVYKVTYRVPIFGEFYSITPNPLNPLPLLQEVDVYPWVEGFDPSPDDYPDEPGNDNWYRFKGWSNTDETI